MPFYKSSRPIKGSFYIPGVSTKKVAQTIESTNSPDIDFNKNKEDTKNRKNINAFISERVMQNWPAEENQIATENEFPTENTEKLEIL